MKRQITYKTQLKLTVSFLALPLGATAISVPAHAQIDDEIIVTATRRSESIQDIPINIAAIGGAQIEQQGFGDISELAAFVPGLNIADQGGRDGNRIVVRGLNVEDIQNGFGQEDGGGTVATYVGEIPLFVDLRLNDLQRVEVLLGPQGTLYGAGTMGGAIRYIPNKPDFTDDLFEVRAGAYTYSSGSGISSDIGFTFNAPISDSFALRGSLDYQNDKGFIDYPYVVRAPGISEPDGFGDASNFRPVKDANTEEIFSGRVAARWQPTDALDATLTYYFQEGEYGGRNTSSFRTANIPATFGSPLNLASDEYEFAGRVEEPNERNSDLIALEVIADLGFAELTSATGYATVEENGQRDQTDLLISLDYYYETFPTFTGFTAEDEETEIFNQEVRLVSKGESRFNWILGAFYNQNAYNALSSEFTPGIGAFNAGFGFRQDLNDLEYFEADRTKLKEKAVFGEVGLDVTEAWDVTFGMRYYDYAYETAGDTQFPYFTTAADFNPYPLSDIKNQIALAPNQSDDGTLFKFNTSYQFGGGNTVYATFSQGFRVGAANGTNFCEGDYLNDQNQGLCLHSPGQELRDGGTAILDERNYSSDTVDNYELGAKTTWLDGAVRLNGAVYFINWNNPQVNTVSINAGTSITVNAESAETKGFELDGSWRVSDHFLMRGNFSYTDAKLTTDVPGLVRAINGQGTFTPDFGYGFGTDAINAQDGDRLPGSPNTQFSVFGDYKHPLSNGASVLVNVGYAWQSEVLSVVGARGGSYTLPSYGRANAAIGYEAGNWSLISFVDNLFNDFSESSAANTPLNNQLVPAFAGDPNPANVRRFRTNVLPPRSIGARFKYRFQ
ncbi:TonB-dependent receptor [Robiginitomaculum antarcticum]|uniref:TonB-dependent receptor n=1 Tax=Robiginitomaculum antarcticum TaxID=437507 RepID=UPI000373E4E6|nr:TonB-dependent receptor [Robiginitomaculum antarcticum]